ncbi:MAG: hypothetical protein OXF49_00735 [Candidatus Saccharibacteria bacterium]|nr:hypothetical protein [Candidatus Saccharibacteria bacterium]
MKLNKTGELVLLNLLNADDSASVISDNLPSITLRSIQGSLVRLNQLGLIG